MEQFKVDSPERKDLPRLIAQGEKELLQIAKARLDEVLKIKELNKGGGESGGR